MSKNTTKTLEQKKTNSWTPVGQATDKKAPAQTNYNKQLYVGAIIESDARPTGVQLKREAKLLTVIGLNTKDAYCRIIFMFVTYDNFFELIRKISPTYNLFLNLYTKSP